MRSLATRNPESAGLDEARLDGPSLDVPSLDGPSSMGAASMRTVLPGLRYAAALSATPQPLADNLILGYRRAGGPGHLSIRPCKPYRRWLPLHGSQTLYMRRQASHSSRESWNSGWIGLARTPLESGAS
jgi:hypothetical protein